MKTNPEEVQEEEEEEENESVEEEEESTEEVSDEEEEEEPTEEVLEEEEEEDELELVAQEPENEPFDEIQQQEETKPTEEVQEETDFDQDDQGICVEERQGEETYVSESTENDVSSEKHSEPKNVEGEHSHLIDPITAPTASILADLKISYGDEDLSKEDNEEEDDKHTDVGAPKEIPTQQDHKGKGIAVEPAEGVFASPTKLVRTSTSDSEMIGNLITSPIFDASVPRIFLPGPSHIAPDMPSKKTATEEPSEKAATEEPSTQAAQKVPSEEKAPSHQEKSTQSMLWKRKPGR